MKSKVPSKTICSILLVLLAAATVATQSYQIAFQGRLSNSGMPANGNYDFEFALFDSLNGGNQLAGVQARNGVAVADGIFAVKLDFGASFPGAGRFLEIRVRQTGQPGMTLLTPRQLIDSSPYSIKSLTADNANAVGGQTAVSVANATLAVNAATPANTPNTLVMRTANGDLSAATFFATQQYNIGAFRVLGINGANNIFVGVNAGLSNTTGSSNAFFGNSAGGANTMGDSNSFFGASAGIFNTLGSSNSFFGRQAGDSNTTGNDNSFFGREAGAANTEGVDNSFFGRNAGLSNSTGNHNAFFGRSAGQFNTTGFDNSFFGRSAGSFNTTGANNSFVGRDAGLFNTTGASNSFFGRSAGRANTTGADNSFYGVLAGSLNTTGVSNSFFGRSAGAANTTAIKNSFFGYFAGAATTTGNSNSFFGAEAGQANTSGLANSFFGERAGSVNTTGTGNTFVGSAAGFANQVGVNNTYVGTGSGGSNYLGNANAFFGHTAGAAIETGDRNTFLGIAAGATQRSGSNNTVVGAYADITTENLSFATAIGAGAVVTTSNTIMLGRRQGQDALRYYGYGNGGGIEAMCRSGIFEITSCGSSLRYKTNINSFGLGLSLINQLKPITFDWKQGGMHDLGLGAEDVEAVEPLLVTYNPRGEVEGVKYDRVGVVLVNAVKEQQAQIESQAETIRRQQLQIDALMKLVCATNASAEICGKEMRKEK